MLESRARSRWMSFLYYQNAYISNTCRAFTVGKSSWLESVRGSYGVNFLTLMNFLLHRSTRHLIVHILLSWKNWRVPLVFYAPFPSTPHHTAMLPSCHLVVVWFKGFWNLIRHHTVWGRVPLWFLVITWVFKTTIVMSIQHRINGFQEKKCHMASSHWLGL